MAKPKRQSTLADMELVIDNFAGGGGASTGIALAISREVDIAINHDPDAIRMHEANHPWTRHYQESVWDVDPIEVTQRRPVGLAWFSPDCTHFSVAKGGTPVKKEIRGLAWVMVKWAALVGFRVGMLENVAEFLTWGPLKQAPNGDWHPDKERAGETFKAFVACMTTGLHPDDPAWGEVRETLGPDFPFEKLEQGLGYKVEWRELRACDYGAPTIRKRLFLIARRDGRPIIWPEPTHGDPISLAVRSGKLKPWRTAAEIIDWSLPCPSIFDRKKPLAESTMRRIARGLKKFVFDNPNPFILKVNHSQDDTFRGQTVDEPMQTITAKNGWGLAVPYIVKCNHTTNVGVYECCRGQKLDEPLQTITSSPGCALVMPTVAAAHIDRQFGKSDGHDANEPLGTITAGGSGKSNLVAAFLAQYHSETGNAEARGQTLDRPILTLDTSNRYALVTSNLVKMYGTTTGQPADEPLHTITAGGFKFGEVRAFLCKYYGACDDGQSLTEPLHTVTAKARFGLVTVEGVDYQIVDIGMRMLEPRELFNAQGFPVDYIIERDAKGNKYPKAAQVARCGNSVSPVIPEALVRGNLPEMCGLPTQLPA